MPTANCDDCGKDISVHAAQCPHCGSPSEHALKSWRKMEEESEQTEEAKAEVLFSDSRVTVTTNSFVTDGKTYSMRNIISVNLVTDRFLRNALYILGIFLALYGVGALLGAILGLYSPYVKWLALCLVPAIPLLVVCWSYPIHVLRFNTSGGQDYEFVVKSNDRQRQEKILAAIKKAISRH